MFIQTLCGGKENSEEILNIVSLIVIIKINNLFKIIISRTAHYKQTHFPILLLLIGQGIS